MDLHYSQTYEKLIYDLRGFYYLMDLHYSQTNWENIKQSLKVLLPYGFTLFSNEAQQLETLAKFYYLMDLHYSQTKV